MAKKPYRPPYRGPVPNVEGMRYTGELEHTNGTVNETYRDWKDREYEQVNPRTGEVRRTAKGMEADRQAAEGKAKRGMAAGGMVKRGYGAACKSRGGKC